MNYIVKSLVQYLEAKGKLATIVAYDVRNTVSVVVRDLERLPEVLDAATAAGANQVFGPALFLQHPEAHEDEARRLAMASARRRAEALARAAGATNIWANLLYLKPGTREHFLAALGPRPRFRPPPWPLLIR